ncbi:hypothetical protein O3M35_010955 [Rhynocoris fuscipes]|uniref:Acyl-coenzyme A oxidase n=1 Tax=Rhynocoris fuscipes TaxID=488301 RepID=A0AAW1D106_9HEMI
MISKTAYMIQTSDGYLDKYRKQASFDWKKMQSFVEKNSRLNVKKKVWSFFESDPLFAPVQTTISSLDEKILIGKQLNKFLHSGIFSGIQEMDFKRRTKYLMLVNEATEMVNPNLSIKFALGISLFANALLSLGTERHLKYYNEVWNGKILSCLALTELEHGSDTKRLKTTATYDKKTQEFILNSPDIGAAKCWIGNLGRQCTHALLFAQLIVDDVCHGLHGFVVPVRDPVTLRPYPRITVGDLGDKAGLNGIDNGYIMFHNYRISRENLLNRIGDINENGEYETSFTSHQRLLGAALESLSAGRVALIQESCNSLIKSVVIAVRYAAQRVQFSDDNGVELPIIEYQTHQWRLFPYVSASYLMKYFVKKLSFKYIDCVAKSRNGEMNMRQMSQMVGGIHAFVCCSKALVTWTSQQAIQECREACGGHGYHKAAGFGDMRNNHDPRVTFEGDNTVLLQQTSNWLLRIYSDPSDVDFSVYPNMYLSFMSNVPQILSQRFTDNNYKFSLKFSVIIHTYQWLICWLAKATKDKMENLKARELDRFKIRSLCQVFKARSLSLVFAEYIIIRHFQEKIAKCGYSSSPKLAENISEGIIELSLELKSEMVALVDSLAPPDFVLNSVLGYSDGRVSESQF